MTIKIKTVYETSDGCKIEDFTKAQEHQLLLDVTKLLRLNIEGISCRDHDAWVKNVISKKDELFEILNRDPKGQVTRN